MSDQREAALKFLMTQKGGVISTVSGDQPQSSFIYYEADEDFSIYFVTTLKTRKYKNLQKNKKVSFTVATIKPPETVQLEGVVEEVHDANKVSAILANYMSTATDEIKDKPPITKLEWEKGLVVFGIKPTWLSWSNYSDHSSREHSVSVVLIGDRVIN